MSVPARARGRDMADQLESGRILTSAFIGWLLWRLVSRGDGEGWVICPPAEGITIFVGPAQHNNGQGERCLVDYVHRRKSPVHRREDLGSKTDAP